MPRDSRVLLEDILESISAIEEYTAEQSAATFARDRKTVDAVVRNLEVIGEAAKGVPEAIRRRHPEIEWPRLAGLRDMLIHQYFGVVVEIVWDVVSHKIPTLSARIEAVLGEL